MSPLGPTRDRLDRDAQVTDPRDAARHGLERRDAGDGGRADGSLPEAAKLVFVSPQIYAKGVVDADAICTSLVRTKRGVEAGVTAIGWVALGGSSPLNRLGPGAGPWVLPSGGEVVFEDRAALTGSGPKTPIIESVDVQIGSGEVWTGILPDAAPTSQDCTRWTVQETNSSTAAVGLIGTTGDRSRLPSATIPPVLS